MNKKTFGIIYLVVSGLVLTLSLYLLITGSIADMEDRTRWTINGRRDMSADYAIETDEPARTIMTKFDADPSLVEQLFINHPLTEDALYETLGLEADAEGAYAYYHETYDAIILSHDITLFYARKNGHYGYMVNPIKGQEALDCQIIISDIKGRLVETIDDISHSSQFDLDLEEGVYIIYSTYDLSQGESISLETKLSKY